MLARHGEGDSRCAEEFRPHSISGRGRAVMAVAGPLGSVLLEGSMKRAALLTAVTAFASLFCGGDTTAPAELEGIYTLVEENGQPLPSDPPDSGLRNW